MSSMENAIKTRANEKLAGIADSLIAKPLFAHTTNAQNLRSILEAGKIAPLKQLAEEAANKLVNAETGLTSFGGREALTAAEAAAKMAPRKDIGKVFLTREGYLPAYGDHIIAKRMPSPERRVSLNLIPEEYATSNPIPLNGADVFVPDEALAQWQKDFPHIGFKPRSKFTGKEYSRWQGAAELPGKLLELLKRRVVNPAGAYLDQLSRKLGLTQASEDLSGILGNRAPITAEQIANASEADLSKLLGYKAHPVGSSALGLAIDKSDLDILLPFASEKAFAKALEDAPARFPGFRPSSLNEGRPLKVFKGQAGDKKIDLVFAHGDPAFAYRDAVERAKSALTDEERYAIIAEKDRLKNAWLFPKIRYENYKKDLANRLGTRTQKIWDEFGSPMS